MQHLDDLAHVGAVREAGTQPDQLVVVPGVVVLGVVRAVEGFVRAADRDVGEEEDAADPLGGRPVQDAVKGEQQPLQLEKDEKAADARAVGIAESRAAAAQEQKNASRNNNPGK